MLQQPKTTYFQKHKERLSKMIEQACEKQSTTKADFSKIWQEMQTLRAQLKEKEEKDRDMD